MFKLKTKRPNNMPSSFDIDDLAFFRIYGFGLRHVELEKGLCEQKNGSARGDAVSLANYGLNENYIEVKHFITRENCLVLQKEMEHFIHQSLKNFHNPISRYMDAAFHLMDRDEDARHPYDFGNYPLGKCGTKAFSADKIIFSIFTDNHKSEDINHATMLIFLELKDKLRQLKIQKLHELMLTIKNENEESKKLIALLSNLIRIYTENSYLDEPVFSIVASLATQPKPSLNDLERLELLLNSAGSEKKGETTLIYTYEEESWHELDETTLKVKLLHYISNQNLPKVEQCLSHLDRNAFATLDSEMQCPLQLAASLPSTAILKAVYNFFPTRYDLLVENENVATPIFLSFRSGEFANTNFLLSQRPMQARDLSFRNNHIFALPPSEFTKEYFHTFDSLLAQGATIGNNIEGLFLNPFAVCLRSFGNANLSPAHLNSMLAVADYHSKYLGLLACSLELYYLNEHSTSADLSDSPQVESFRILEEAIFASLTLAECVQINKLFLEETYTENAKQRLFNDLSKIARVPEQARKFKLCFQTNSIEATESYQTYNPYHLWQRLSGSKQESIPSPIVENSADEDFDDLAEMAFCSIQ